MQLRKPKAVGALDDYQRCVGYIDADLDHRRRDQHRHLGPLERRHDFILVRPFHAPVHEPHPLPEAQAKELRALFGGGLI